MTTPSAARPSRAADAILRAAIVGLALGTAYIHSTLGGLLFMLNAIGYVLGAAAMVAPFAIAGRFRWIVRIGLASYATATIVAWVVQGPFYSTAYLAKAIELALIALLAIDLIRADGDRIDLVRCEVRARLGRTRGRVSGSA
jgi:hypothetical protein